MSHTVKLSLWAGSFACIVACNAIVGVEDVYEGPRPGTGANAGTSSDGGTKSGAGTHSDGGTTSDGGTPADDGGDGNVAPQGGSDGEPLGGASGVAGDGTNPSAGDGSGGAAEPAPGRVTGHVIDFWRHPLPNISVQVGDALVTTDKNGAFTVEDVPATYDVSMTYTYTSAFQVTAWAYLGLTRRDPTLQMYVGSDRRVGDLDISFVPKPTLATNQKIAVALGGKDGANVYDAVSANGTTEFPDWYGPATTSQTAHGLLWQTTAQKLPTSYIAYKSASLSLNETDTQSLTLDLTASSIATGNLQGTVTPAGVGTRRNLVFLRFTSNATIQLVNDAAGADNFDYLTPTIPNSKLLVAATEGGAFDGYAVAYADGLAPSAKPKLVIPTPMTPATPSSGATKVDDKTRFSFGGDTPGPYVVNFYSQDPDDAGAPASRYQAIYVVTAQKQFTIPQFLGGGFTLYPDRRYIWTVATHGPYASVDALANEAGFLDPFSWDEETAQGPSQKGQFTDSSYREFRTAP